MTLILKMWAGTSFRPEFVGPEAKISSYQHIFGVFLICLCQFQPYQSEIDKKYQFVQILCRFIPKKLAGASFGPDFFQSRGLELGWEVFVSYHSKVFNRFQPYQPFTVCKNVKIIGFYSPKYFRPKTLDLEIIPHEVKN